METIVLERAAISAPVKSRLRFGRKHLALSGLALGITLGGIGYGHYWWNVGRFIETTDDAYVGGNVTTLSPHVAGFVSQILVGDNQFVKAGELVITLDDRDYKANLAHAEAVVQNQTAALANLHAKYTLQQSMIEQAEAKLAADQAEAGWARADAARYHKLALTTYGTAQADLRTAQLNLGYTEIRSPIDGYVGNRAAQIGAYTTVGTALLAITPAHGLWVDANFKEDQLARMQPGEKAIFFADVLPGRTFTGRVLSLAPATGAVFSVIPPENATGNFTKIVQRVPVRIVVDDSDGTLGLLRPGLSTTVSVDTRAPSENEK